MQVFIVIVLIFLTGCNHPISFQPTNQDIFTQGYKDGCKTADGVYTKNHKFFNDNLDYHEGWFSGRKECNH